MARWQLQCSGKAEEDRCKFCQAQLPNWRLSLFKDLVGGDSGSEASDGARREVKADRAARPERGRPPRFGARNRGGGGATRRTSVDDVDDDSSRPRRGGRRDRGSSSRRTSFEDVPPTGSAAAAAAASASASAASASEASAASALDDVKGDIIVKFNDMSFRCKVRTGQEGLEDFMAQIREKCGIPEDKMRCLNLTYRCKDPNTGSQMTLQGVNESAFDAAVLCSAAQDKIKQRKRASRDGGRRGAAEKPGAASNEASREKKASPNASALAPASSEPDSSSGGHSDGSAGATSTASGKTKQRERFFGEREDGGDAASTRPCPGSPGKSGRFEYRGCDATSTRARGRRSSLDEDPADVATREFLRGARRLSAPPPSSSGFGVASAGPSPSAGDEAPASRRRARKSPWPSFMRAWSGSEA